ncbi:MAG: PIN domain-containing protein [Abditibacteriales bacterium]|nr:PIN domain-containing protein [Abditibacteriales bacterium]
MTRKGCDSGFFLLMGVGHASARQVWQDAVAGQHELVMSTLSVNEVLVAYYRQGKSQEAADFLTLIQSAPWLRIVPTSLDIVQRSAGYRHGLGLPTVDSVILATAVMEGCDELLTTDSHFLIAMTQGVIAVTVLS